MGICHEQETYTDMQGQTAVAADHLREQLMLFDIAFVWMVADQQAKVRSSVFAGQDGERGKEGDCMKPYIRHTSI